MTQSSPAETLEVVPLVSLTWDEFLAERTPAVSTLEYSATPERSVIDGEGPENGEFTGCSRIRLVIITKFSSSIRFASLVLFIFE